MTFRCLTTALVCYYYSYLTYLSIPFERFRSVSDLGMHFRNHIHRLWM